MSKKALLAVLAVVFFVAYGLIYVSRVKPEKKVTRTVTQVAPESELKKWRDGEFLPAVSPDLKALVEERVNAASVITDAQRLALATTLDRFFAAYSTGSYEEYLNFKTESLPHEYDFTGLIEKIIKSAQASDPRPFPEEGSERARRVWEAVAAPDPTSGLGPQLLQVDAGSLKIVIQTNKTVGRPAQELAKLASSMYPSGAPDTLIKYAQSPEVVLKRDGALLTALVQFVGKYSSAADASPVVLAFYWSRETKAWHPWQMAKFPAAKYRVMF